MTWADAACRAEPDIWNFNFTWMCFIWDLWYAIVNNELWTDRPWIQWSPELCALFVFFGNMFATCEPSPIQQQALIYRKYLLFFVYLLLYLQRNIFVFDTAINCELKCFCFIKKIHTHIRTFMFGWKDLYWVGRKVLSYLKGSV